MSSLKVNAIPLTSTNLGGIQNIPQEFIQSVTVTEVETPGIAKDEAIIPLDGFLVYESRLDQKVTGERTQFTTEVTTFPPLDYQKFEPKYGFTFQSTTTIVPSQSTLGNANTTVQPLNNRYDLSTVDTAPIDELNAFARSFPITVNLDLPATLTGVQIIWLIFDGGGVSAETGATDFSGASGYLSLDITNSAQGSVSYAVEVVPTIIERNGRNVFAQQYFFFLPDGASESDVITAISSLFAVTVNPWLAWSPQPQPVALVSAKATVHGSNSARVSGSYDGTSGTNSTAESTGEEQNIDGSGSLTIKEIKPTIHGAITFSSNTGQDSYSGVTISVTSKAYISGTLTAGSNTSTTTTATLPDVEVSPTSLTATTGDHVIPTSGLYLYSIDSESYDWSYTMIRAIVVDFSKVPAA